MKDFSCETLPGPPVGEITRMVERRNRGLALVEQAIELIVEAQQTLPEYALESVLSNQRWGYSLPQYKARVAKDFKTAIDKRCWRELLDKSKLGVVMTAAQDEAVRKRIEEDAPELTNELALGTFAVLFERRGETFSEGLVDVFKSLSGNYKSNDAFKIGPRLILSPHGKSMFADMAKYLMLLDGEDPTTHGYDQRPENIVAAAINAGQGEVSFPWFDVKMYAKGTWHVWLKKRPDLIRKVNDLIARHYGETIPGSR